MPQQLERIESERSSATEDGQEEGEEILLLAQEGQGKGRSTTALKEGTVAARRKGRKAVESDEGEGEEDKMDED